ncbi:hypothetical protein LCGC14_1759380 [marine sediment metagenome]|uniref:Uncharacterized protein n=1 Tax=marine sediment metagenome TaxID=412755 RepID=A0A0F9H1L2_9ZZZZ
MLSLIGGVIFVVALYYVGATIVWYIWIRNKEVI